MTNGKIFRPACLSWWLAALMLLASSPAAHATGDKDKDKDREEYDAHTLRFELFWNYSQPTGHYQSQSNLGSRDILDVHKDIGFNSYDTFLGKADWKFTHKNHLYFLATNFSQTKNVVLRRTITFQGKTYNVGATATGGLDSLFLCPGYQYDFIRRRALTIGVQVQLNLLEITGSMSALAQVNNGVPQPASFSSGRLRAPLPVAGPTVRWYFIPNSSRVFVDAN